MAHFEDISLFYNNNALMGFEITCKLDFQTVELQKYAKFQKNPIKSCTGYFSDISYSERVKTPRVDLFRYFVPYMSLVQENTLNTPCLYLIPLLNWSYLHQPEKNHAPKMAIFGHFSAYNAKYRELSIR